MLLSISSTKIFYQSFLANLLQLQQRRYLIGSCLYFVQPRHNTEPTTSSLKVDIILCLQQNLNYSGNCHHLSSSHLPSSVPLSLYFCLILTCNFPKILWSIYFSFYSELYLPFYPFFVSLYSSTGFPTKNFLFQKKKIFFLCVAYFG